MTALFTGVAVLFVALYIAWASVTSKRLTWKVGAFSKLLERETKRARIAPINISERHIPAKNGYDERLVWGAVSVDSLSSPLEAWQQWHSIDVHVFEAFSQMTHQPIDNLADLTKLVDIKHYPIDDYGFLQSVKGHVGEWQVNADFASMHPAMASSSNNAGADLWIEGHAANVKTISDASSVLASHFANNPEIAAIIPFDAAHIPSEALYYHPGNQFDIASMSGEHLVIVDSHLSNAEVLAHTHHAFNAVEHPAGGFHFPLITLAVTGFAEGRLFVRGETSLTRAAVNTLATTAAVGGGMLGGKIAGATVGTAIAPGLGTIVGAAAGGLLGGLAGKLGVNALRKHRLKRAYDAFALAQNDYFKMSEATAAWVEGAWIDNCDEIQAELSGRLQSLRDEAVPVLEDLSAQLVATNAMSIDEARSYLDSVTPMATERLARVARLSKLFAVGFLWNAERLHLERWVGSSTELMERWIGTPDDVALLFDLVMLSPTGEGKVRKYLSLYFDSKKRAYNEGAEMVRSMTSRAIRERAGATANLRTAWSRVDSEATTRLRPTRVTLRDTAQQLRKELCAMGAAQSEAASSLNTLLALPSP